MLIGKWKAVGVGDRHRGDEGMWDIGCTRESHGIYKRVEIHIGGCFVRAQWYHWKFYERTYIIMSRGLLITLFKHVLLREWFYSNCSVLWRDMLEMCTPAVSFPLVWWC